MAICFGGLRSYLVSIVAILDSGIDQPLFYKLPLVKFSDNFYYILQFLGEVVRDL